MKFEVLKRGHLKRNMVIVLLVVAIISAIILNFTKAKYRTTESIPLVNGTINYSLTDLNIVAIKVDGKEVDVIPDGNYELTRESYCTVDGEEDTNIKLNYDSTTKTLTVTPMTMKGTKCYLYFEETKTLLADTIMEGKNIQTRNSFSGILSGDTTGIIYQAEDNDGTTYYFAGNPTDNWVKFAGFYWRIIRINGDGSIRMIYQGTSTNTIGSGTQINTSVFNNSSNNNMYVGYVYSSIKEVLENWYKEYLLDYADQISKEAGFCGDRTPYSGSGIGTTYTEYIAYDRLLNNETPSYKCEDSRDIYTVRESSKGNKGLNYPIGLITADEVAYAGGVWGASNIGYYLYTEEYYWTITPSRFTYDRNAWVLCVRSDGYLDDSYVKGDYGIRPVINLSSNVKVKSGNGTSSTPYEI